MANVSAACSGRVEPVDAFMRAQVTAAEVAGFDETGMRATGSLYWLHTASTQAMVRYDSGCRSYTRLCHGMSVTDWRFIIGLIPS